MQRLTSRITGIIFAFWLAFTMSLGLAEANAVEWNSGFIEADGYGVPPATVTNASQGRLLARRAAVVDAQRHLLEIISGVHVDAETTVQNMMVTNDIIKSRVTGMIRGAVISNETQLTDGSYKVTLRLPLYGVKGLQQIIPQINPSLEKVNPEISKKILEKQGDSASLLSDDITINLNWYHSRKGNVNENEKVDLDLGFFWKDKESRQDVVDQLNIKKNGSGSFSDLPYAKLTVDDRSGNSLNGETIKINGKKAAAMKRFLIYSYIYDGVPAWEKIDGVVTIKQPNQPDIIIKLDAKSNDQKTCAIATIEIDENGKMKITRVDQYFDGTDSMDKAFNWGFNWVNATKD